jgi:hypothetical protein
MTKELNLDGKQQEKLKQLLPSKSSKSYPEGRDEKKRKEKKQKKKMDEKMNAILTRTSG